MSKTFEEAADALTFYFKQKMKAADNTTPPVWFCEYRGPSYQSMMDFFDPSEANTELSALYKKARQKGKTGVRTDDIIRLRKQISLMVTASQALRRRYVATSADRPRTPVDLCRYAKESTAAALNIYTAIKEEYKDKAAPAAAT